MGVPDSQRVRTRTERPEAASRSFSATARPSTMKFATSIPTRRTGRSRFVESGRTADEVLSGAVAVGASLRAAGLGTPAGQGAGASTGTGTGRAWNGSEAPECAGSAEVSGEGSEAAGTVMVESLVGRGACVDETPAGMAEPDSGLGKNWSLRW